MTVFMSYARANANDVRRLREGIEDQGHEVYFDGEIRGGELWWDDILAEIEQCYAFVFALSPESARSRACYAELTYAIGLKKPIVPVTVKKLGDQDAPSEIQLTQTLDFTEAGRQFFGELDQELDKARDSPAVPIDSAVVKPEPPITDLGFADELLRQAQISGDQQQQLLNQLAELVTDEDDREPAVRKLEELRRHKDRRQEIVAQIDELLAQYRSGPTDEESIALVEVLIDGIQNDEAVPILGSGMTDWIVGTRREVAREWAEENNFPMKLHDLPQVAQYISVIKTKKRLRRGLRDLYHQRLLDRFGDIVDGDDGHLDDLIVKVWEQRSAKVRADPHTVLASLPFKIYVTADPTSLLRTALEQAEINGEKRRPVSAYCQWNPEVRRGKWSQPAIDAEDDYEPSAERPLVFHVFGKLDVPESLVITEDEYLDFLAAVSENHDLIPADVRAAMSDANLLLLGFGLQDWDIRILLRALVDRNVAHHLSNEYRHVAAELDEDYDVLHRDRARTYLSSYYKGLRPNIDVMWATIEQFCDSMSRSWEPGA